MHKRLNALLLFAKLPEAGKVKTRLSVLKDGVFSPEDASELFEAMLLDVIDISLSAFDTLQLPEAGNADTMQLPESGKITAQEEGQVLESSSLQNAPADEYRLYISTAPTYNVDAMRKLVENASIPSENIRFIGDSGSSFDEHYNDAFDQVWKDGADCILSMGADMPALSADDIIRGFEALHSFGKTNTDDNTGEPNFPCGIVISPDQEMGVSIVGWTRDTKFNHTGVFYNESGLTVLPAYISKAQNSGLPVKLIPPVPDVDTMGDLMHNITLLKAAEYAYQFGGSLPAKRTIEKLIDLGCFEVRVPPNELRDPRDIIDG